MSDAKSGPIRLAFNPQLRVEFRGATVTSDAGLLLSREMDERLGLGALIEQHLADPRTGHNRQCPVADLVARRQSSGGGAVQRGTRMRRRRLFPSALVSVMRINLQAYRGEQCTYRAWSSFTIAVSAT